MAIRHQRKQTDIERQIHDDQNQHKEHFSFRKIKDINPPLPDKKVKTNSNEGRLKTARRRLGNGSHEQFALKYTNDNETIPYTYSVEVP